VTLLKFFLKMLLVFIIAVSAVYYHNTESGKALEQRIGKELEYDRLQTRGGKYLDKTIDFVVNKGMEKVGKTLNSSKADEPDGKDHSASGKARKEEKIKMDERKRLEQIIEQGETK